MKPAEYEALCERLDREFEKAKKLIKLKGYPASIEAYALAKLDESLEKTKQAWKESK